MHCCYGNVSTLCLQSQVSPKVVSIVGKATRDGTSTTSAICMDWREAEQTTEPTAVHQYRLANSQVELIQMQTLFLVLGFVSVGERVYS